jgi:hypothetical protein
MLKTFDIVVSFLLLSLLGLALVSTTETTSAADIPKLIDRAKAAGIARSERSWSTSVVDFNRDGRMDILNVFHQWTDSYLYRANANGTYSVAFKWLRANSQGGVPDRHDCQWADVDGNGRPDAYCSAGRNLSNRVKIAKYDNELWLQLGPGQFTERGTEWGAGDPCGRGRRVAWLDVNRDRRPDLFVGNQAERDVPTDPCNNPANGYLPETPKVFINDAGRRLRYSSAWSKFQPASGSLCALPLDFNRDGRIDLLTCTSRDTRASLYRNTGSGFVDVSSTIPIGKVADAAIGDLNNDGINDLVLSDVNGVTYRRGLASGFGPSVRVWTAPANADGKAVAIGDIQGDGLQDIYVVTDSTRSSVNPDDSLLVNNGRFSFVPVRAPSARGMGDAVATVAGRNGQDQFVVLNGLDTAIGPVQLIAAAP